MNFLIPSTKFVHFWNCQIFSLHSPESVYLCHSSNFEQRNQFHMCHRCSICVQNHLAYRFRIGLQKCNLHIQIGRFRAAYPWYRRNLIFQCCKWLVRDNYFSFTHSNSNPQIPDFREEILRRRMALYFSIISQVPYYPCLVSFWICFWAPALYLPYSADPISEIHLQYPSCFNFPFRLFWLLENPTDSRFFQLTMVCSNRRFWTTFLRRSSFWRQYWTCSIVDFWELTISLCYFSPKLCCLPVQVVPHEAEVLPWYRSIASPIIQVIFQSKISSPQDACVLWCICSNTLVSPSFLHLARQFDFASLESFWPHSCSGRSDSATSVDFLAWLCLSSPSFEWFYSQNPIVSLFQSFVSSSYSILNSSFIFEFGHGLTILYPSEAADSESTIPYFSSPIRRSSSPEMKSLRSEGLWSFRYFGILILSFVRVLRVFLPTHYSSAIQGPVSIACAPDFLREPGTLPSIFLFVFSIDFSQNRLLWDFVPNLRFSIQNVLYIQLFLCLVRPSKEFSDFDDQRLIALEHFLRFILFFWFFLPNLQFLNFAQFRFRSWKGRFSIPKHFSADLPGFLDVHSLAWFELFCHIVESRLGHLHFWKFWSFSWSTFVSCESPQSRASFLSSVSSDCSYSFSLVLFFHFRMFRPRNLRNRKFARFLIFLVAYLDFLINYQFLTLFLKN